ncbi:PTS sugar transporter subunit IIA [bacterium]|nr:MAG: PTS sugar transporter subunit IIA [bacterium]
MRVADFLRKEWIIPDLASHNKEGALSEMVGVLEKTKGVPDAGKALTVLLEREQLGSTGIGEGIAIPHGKLSEIGDVVSVFALSRNGVDFDSMDGAPVHILFLLIAPENSASLHLKALARISRLLKSRQFRDELIKQSSVEDLFDLIVSEDEKY